ncbi:MAG: sulfatase-like hydrolase/transferase [Chitinophagaceae bacterium]|nr:sulfatase-like hydrolase/transferase [Chitinophagaceae bacterium]MCW5904504.1 sulfatase-like hydrolase/transferase [Chitinophagaceae bacterium]
MKKVKIPRYIAWLIQTGIIFLILMSLLRWLLVIFFRTPSEKSISLIDAYLLGFRFDVRFVAIALLLIFLIGNIPFLHPINKKWGERTAFLIWTIFIVTLCVFYAADFAHYSYLRQRLNANVLNFLQDAKISFSMMWQSYHLGWIIIGLILLSSLLLGIVKLNYNYILSKPNVSTKKSKIIWAIIFVLLMAYCIVGNIVLKGGQYPLRWSNAYTLGSDYAANIALNPFQSFFSTMKFRTITYDKAKVQEHYDWMSAYLGVPENERDTNTLHFKRSITNTSNTLTQQPIQNVVLVICESFSAYKSSMYGNPLNTTPFFAEMCKQGVFFDRAFSPAYGTARGVWAIVTGIPDVQLYKTSSRNPAAVNQHTIINDFKNYEKFYFLGGSSSWANIRGLLTNNIENLNLYEQGSYSSEEIDVWGISDKNLFLEANKVLAKQNKPFFAVIQTADNHRPYTIPKDDLKEFKKQKIKKDSLKKYGFENNDEYNAFRYTDFSFEKFIEAARKEKYFNNTLFVFIGDHGIRGDAGNILPKAFTTQGLTNMHVPLLFYAPSILKPATSNLPASQMDVLPSIAYLCNIDYTNTTLGRNLFSLENNDKNYAFIFDESAKIIGALNKTHFYNYQMKDSQIENFESIINNNPVTNDSLKKQMRFITDAFYETSRYMLLNNKKQIP